MKMNIIPVFAAAASIVLAAGCHHRHHEHDYYRSGPPRHDHYHHDRDGWEQRRTKPVPKPRPHYITANHASYPRLYQLL